MFSSLVEWLVSWKSRQVVTKGSQRVCGFDEPESDEEEPHGNHIFPAGLNHQK